MSLTVLDDARRRPRAFHWRGAVAAANLRAWLDSIAYSVPDDLIELWRTVGGGDLFETKEVYAPDGTEDDLRAVTEYMATHGLRPDFTVFHRGIWVSVLDHATGELVALDKPSLYEEARFTTFDDWYRLLPRAEFGERYGLVDPE